MSRINKTIWIEEGPTAFMVGFNEASGFFVTQMEIKTVEGEPMPRPTSGIRVPMSLMQKFVDAFNELFSDGGDNVV